MGGVEGWLVLRERRLGPAARNFSLSARPNDEMRRRRVSEEEEEGLVGCSLAMFDAGIYCTSSVNYGRQLQGLRAVSNVD